MLDKPRDTVIIHMYLEPGASPVETLALIAARMEAANIASTVETEGVAQEDWQNGWRKYYHPLEIGKRLAVVPLSLIHIFAMVTVEGVECSEDTVKDGSYKIQRPFVFVTNKSAALSEQAQAFVDFATSKDAAELIRTAGAVPVNE